MIMNVGNAPVPDITRYPSKLQENSITRYFHRESEVTKNDYLSPRIFTPRSHAERDNYRRADLNQETSKLNLTFEK